MILHLSKVFVEKKKQSSTNFLCGRIFAVVTVLWIGIKIQQSLMTIYYLFLPFRNFSEFWKCNQSKTS